MVCFRAAAVVIVVVVVIVLVIVAAAVVLVLARGACLLLLLQLHGVLLAWSLRCCCLTYMLHTTASGATETFAATNCATWALRRRRQIADDGGP